MPIISSLKVGTALFYVEKSSAEPLPMCIGARSPGDLGAESTPLNTDLALLQRQPPLWKQFNDATDRLVPANSLVTEI